MKFWESVQSRIQLDEYVIDFCMLPTGEVYYYHYYIYYPFFYISCFLTLLQIWIVELNPFVSTCFLITLLLKIIFDYAQHAHTSACMFTWKEDRDIIINGPFTFRYLKSTPVNATSILPPFWNRYIREYAFPLYFYLQLFFNLFIIIGITKEQRGSLISNWYVQVLLL